MAPTTKTETSSQSLIFETNITSIHTAISTSFMTTDSRDRKVQPHRSQKKKDDVTQQGAIIDANISCGSCYMPPPLISGSMIWSVGLFIFSLTMIWRPLILLMTFIASIFFPYCFRITDEACHRRFMLHQFDKNDYISAHLREIPQDVRLETRYWTNARGLNLFTTIMTPLNEPIKAVVGFCHGYTDNPSHTRRRELTYLVQHGIAVVMIEYEGHGRSDGRLGLIGQWSNLLEDVNTFFQEISSTVFPNKKFFLMGESMGGAVAFSIIRDNPNIYSGVVFQCPMCKIADDMLPPDWVIELCQKLTGPTGVVNLLGYLPIAPTKCNIQHLTYKLPYKRAIHSRTPAIFGRRPRLASARELINVTKEISRSLSKFEAPFLVQHGDSDKVTDPELSKALYEEARSDDKTIYIYEGMWHSLTGGEPDENVKRVQDDATKWILERAETKEP